MRFAKLLLFTAVLTLSARPAAAMSRGTPGYTLIVVPDSPAAIQITHDLGSRYPILLVSYDFPGNPANPFFNVLHNNQWIRVPNDQFTSGSFLQQRPRRTIVVGDDNPMTEALLGKVAAWSAQVINHPASNPTFLLNMYGRDFNFTKSDWRWFARKYDLDLKDANSGRAQNWYTQPYVDETRTPHQTNFQSQNFQPQAPAAPAQPPRAPRAAPPEELPPAVPTVRQLPVEERPAPPSLTPEPPQVPAPPKEEPAGAPAPSPAFRGWQTP